MTKTERVTEEFRRRLDEALAFAIEAGINTTPLFRRRWESITPDEPPSAILILTASRK